LNLTGNKRGEVVKLLANSVSETSQTSTGKENVIRQNRSRPDSIRRLVEIGLKVKK
jgi:hypothetical protein